MMAGRRWDRSTARAARRRARYLDLITAAHVPSRRIAYAADYVRALIAGADPQVAAAVGEQVVEYLLTTAETLEPTKGGRR
ncbi:hypothetical protein [Pseudonocardia asaccharolytica]|nr:hypothetical protein [Pseudonocardia asaccharolytica]